MISFGEVDGLCHLVTPAKLRRPDSQQTRSAWLELPVDGLAHSTVSKRFVVNYDEISSDLANCKQTTRRLGQNDLRSLGGQTAYVFEERPSPS